MTTYEYTKQINSNKLLLEIAGSLSLVLDGTDGNISVTGTAVKISFNTALSGGDKTTLDGIVSSHSDYYPEDDFSADLYLTSFKETYGTLARHTLAKKAPSFVSELKYHNFPALKELLDHLLSEEEINQTQYDSIKGIFDEQNVDLDDY